MKRIDFLKKTAATATILCSGAINFSCDNKKSKKIFTGVNKFDFRFICNSF